MTSSAEPAVALTIAGSDSGAGAGIQADIKAMTSRGVHGCTAITALTAQNSTGVEGIEPVHSGFVEQQIRAVVEDFEVTASKTGMLHNRSVIQAVVEERSRLGQLVVDPVMVAESGDPLLETEAEQAMARSLVPVADLVTPNWPEAQKLAKHVELDETESPEGVAKSLAAAYDGPAFLLKGGHTGESTCTDRLVESDGTLHEFTADRIDTDYTHGAGCAYSSLITAELSKGTDLVEAVQRAKDDVTDAIRRGYACGRGAGTLNFLS